MKEWVEGILPLERDLFFALNGSESLFLDNVMWTISGRLVWIPLYLFILFLFFYRVPRKEGILAALFLILLFVLCDQVSSSLFKPLFERFRPTHHLDFKDIVDTVNDYRGGLYGFISGHATNSFGLAVFLSLLFKHRAVTLITLFWAALNSYTRIYLGVHFVSDILAGMLAGSLLALLVYLVYSWTRKKVLHSERVEQSEGGHSSLTQLGSPYRKHGTMFVGSVAIYLAVVILFSSFLATLPH